ncbi:MAG: SCE4755 family polysaccharide monooxygenase-like protein [Deltaproteobacteria bacterium]|nr:SCE4755 family polysaccharide monooxygenase-like protein [Deltaproteobacteria bacterium]
MRRSTVLAAAVLAGFLASPAAAHLALVFPPSRAGGDVLKEGPCGQAGSTRSGHVTALVAGRDLEVVWDEYVDHPGHFRIAFDADGDDDFVDPACLSGCQTRAPQIERYSNAAVLLDGIADTAGGEGRATITLPDIDCDTCTLQVIQVMYDKPPYAPGTNDIYYQCADLVLRRAAAGCAGDCDGDGRVTVAELIRAVGIALGSTAIDDCRAADANGDGQVTVEDLIADVEAALAACTSRAR